MTAVQPRRGHRAAMQREAGDRLDELLHEVLPQRGEVVGVDGVEVVAERDAVRGEGRTGPRQGRRINVQLVSTETGSHLWADRFDRELSDLVAGCDDVLARMRGALGFSLIGVEAGRSRRERPANPDAFDLILRARVDQPASQPRPDAAGTGALRAGVAPRSELGPRHDRIGQHAERTEHELGRPMAECRC